MEYMRLRLRNQLPFFVAMLVSLAFPAKAQRNTSKQAQESHPEFTDVTFTLGLNFRNMASHTSKKYLIETMGPGVALFDYDNDGRLDIFVVNGAPVTDPTPKGAIPQKTGPKYWNRLYHQKQDGTFEDVTEKAGLQGVGSRRGQVGKVSAAQKISPFS
jgi:enediyne biosynthesis protein E4